MSQSNYSDEEINEFIEKINRSNIFPPKHSADKIVVTDLNKEGFPKRAMNCFFCFRHVVYLEVVEQKLLDAVKDGVFFTQATSAMWNNASKGDRDNYKELAAELKLRQNDFHKNKNYNKVKPHGTVFVSMNDIHKKTTRKKKTTNNTNKMQPKKKRENSSQSQQIIQKNVINQINQNIQQAPCDFSSPQFNISTQSIEAAYPADNYPYQTNYYPLHSFNIYDPSSTFVFPEYLVSPINLNF